MNNKEILKGYDDLLEGKKVSATLSKLIVGASVIIVLAVLFFAYSIHITSIKQIKVVDVSGKELKSDLVREEKMFKSMIETHCSNAVYYANTFDRLTILENQSRGYFLINRADANRIFSMYKNRRAYSDAMDRGVVYKTLYKELKSLSGDKYKAHVVFTAICSVYDNSNPVQQFLLTVEGDIVPVSPQFPENQAGMYFPSYVQSYQKIENE